jgi:hypothetical protein
MTHRNAMWARALQTSVLAALLAVGGAACSAASGDDASPSKGSTGGAPNGGRDEPGLSLGGGDIKTGTGGSAGSLGTGGVCKAESHEGQRVPLDMYFLVDSSLSMDEDIPGGGTRWAAVSSALMGFLESPSNADVALGLGYFPVVPPAACKMGDPGCICLLTLCFNLSFELASCNVDDYSTPTVPLALPPNAGPLISDLQAHQLNGGTPTRPALEGAVKYVNTWAAAHPDRKSVIVLATDGEPTGCLPNSAQDVADVAAAALASTAAIQTFVIGVGSSLQSLNLIAEAGGTKQAYLVEDTNAASAFAEALEQIRGAASPCDFLIPTEGVQGKIDPTQVNVDFTPTGSATPVLIAQTSDGSAATCGPEGGWHYDNPAAPQAIKLCPASCSLVNSGGVQVSGGTVQVQFGCETVRQVPK